MRTRKRILIMTAIACIALLVVVAGGLALMSRNTGKNAKTTTASFSEITDTTGTANEVMPRTEPSEPAAEGQAAPQEDVTTLNVTGWTTGSNINLRQAANTDAPILQTLAARTEVTEIAQQGDWIKVEYEGQTGFIKAEYLTTEEPAAPAAGGKIICIDPGHQANGDSTPEPNGPGSSATKARVTGGTHGTTTGVYEYQLTLDISQKLRDELTARGYTVYMTRETHDVNISNMERAQYAASVGADISVRIHANGADGAGANGALALVPSGSNPYVANLASESQRLGQNILSAYCAATGMANQGVQTNDTMTGINWCTMPVMILEMGYMTNPTDDTNMEDPSYQAKMVQGIADGIDAYFSE